VRTLAKQSERVKNSLLETESLTVRFGGLAAVKEVTLECRENEILGIIGPNGAGKTTLINLVSGIYFANSGHIVFDGKDITRVPAHMRCRAGIGRTFQTIQLVKELSASENIMLGCLFGRGLGLGEAREKTQELCQFLELLQPQRYVSQLTMLEIKKVELARALAITPKLLFLDEVMAGLSISETRAMIDLVKKIGSQGVTICAVEHVMMVIRDLTERVIVLDGGRIICDGPYEQVCKDPKVVDAYLGKEE
jgi:branched-chain amino acid transport system ATP-binding protein